jgi:glycosyltransferase involved in cell wall biosynthesis
VREPRSLYRVGLSLTWFRNCAASVDHFGAILPAMDASPAISVCMPASRNHRWFRDALSSAAWQTRRDIEIIVSDDSGGALEEVVVSMSDPRIRYYKNLTPLKFAGNHIKCLDLARGRFVAFLHDDDLWVENYLVFRLSIRFQ